jgi:hypothetical protein
MQDFAEKSTIKEIYHIRDILNFIHYDTWVIWDLDNTIIQARHELGSDMWFTMLMTETIRRFNHDAVFVRMALELYNYVQHMTHTEPAELNVVNIINRLHEIGVPQMIITSRSEALRHTTLRQLRENGIHFYSNMILFCDGQNKGQHLEQFWLRTKNVPSHFIMIDDKPSHLVHMQELAQKYQITFQGFAYRYLDAKVKAFDMNKANHQLMMLKRHFPEELQEGAELLSVLEKPASLVKLDKTFTYFFAGKYHQGKPMIVEEAQEETDDWGCRIS